MFLRMEREIAQLKQRISESEGRVRSLSVSGDEKNNVNQSPVSPIQTLPTVLSIGDERYTHHSAAERAQTSGLKWTGDFPSGLMRILKKRCSGGCRNWTCWTERITTHSHCLQTPCRYTTTAHTLTSNRNTLSLSSDSLQVYNYSSHTDFKPQHTLTVFRLPAGIQLQLTHSLQTATHSHCLQTPCRYTTTANTLTSNHNTLSLSSDSLQVYNYS